MACAGYCSKAPTKQLISAAFNIPCMEIYVLENVIQSIGRTNHIFPIKSKISFVFMHIVLELLWKIALSLCM